MLINEIIEGRMMDEYLYLMSQGSSDDRSKLARQRIPDKVHQVLARYAQKYNPFELRRIISDYFDIDRRDADRFVKDFFTIPDDHVPVRYLNDIDDYDDYDDYDTMRSIKPQIQYDDPVPARRTTVPYGEPGVKPPAKPSAKTSVPTGSITNMRTGTKPLPHKSQAGKPKTTRGPQPRAGGDNNPQYSTGGIEPTDSNIDVLAMQQQGMSPSEIEVALANDLGISRNQAADIIRRSR